MTIYLKVILKIALKIPLVPLYLLVILSFCFSCEQKLLESKRTNILLIFPDQLRADFIGAKGGNWVYTPNIDRLAKEGALFSRAYTSTPTCLPARAALLTGKTPWNHGLLTYAPIATKYDNEMPQILKSAGYATFATGKLHYKPIGGPRLKVKSSELDNRKFMHGFDEIKLCEGWGHPQNAYNIWFKEKAPELNIDGTGLGPTDHRSGTYPYPEELHPTAWTAKQAINFLNEYESTDPFFIKVAFHRPHPPFDPPKRWLEFYKNKDIPKAVVGEWSQDKFGDKNDIPSMDKPMTNPIGNFGDQVVRDSREGYLAAISFLDEQIGLIISTLEERGELENTLILLSSDHGDMMGDHHLWRKSYPYEGSAGVPMIIRWPESLNIQANRGQVINELVELRDVLPTFLDIAKLPVPDAIDGMSMLDLIRGKKDNWRKVLDLEHGMCYWTENGWTGLTDSKYKYIYYNYTAEEQLFDLDNDPWEKNNLAETPEFKDILQVWRKKMIDHLAVRGEPWVVNGDLGTWQEPIKFSPNYPMEYYPKEIVN
ncbi:MAG: arylsulfatase [Cyclobacteriaceae bacterium]|jgi:arylsulfatase A-like enzyme